MTTIARPDTAKISEDIWALCFQAVDDNSYLNEALKIINKMHTAGTLIYPTPVHQKLREIFKIKYQALDSKYNKPYEKTKGLSNIARGLNNSFKKNKIPLRLNQWSLLMYSEEHSELPYHLVKVGQS